MNELYALPRYTILSHIEGTGGVVAGTMKDSSLHILLVGCLDLESKSFICKLKLLF